MSDKCTYCGCNRPHHDAMDRVVNEKFEIGQRFRKMYAQHAEEIARRELAFISLQEGQKWTQQKIRKQSAQLRRLEEKLRKQGVHPYAEVPEVEGDSAKYVSTPRFPEITGM